MKLDDVELIARLFSEAALKPDVWPDALQQFATSIGATGAVGQMVGDGGYIVLPSAGYEDSIRDYFGGGWQHRNPRLERGMALTRAGARGFITEYHMFSPAELARDPFQQEFARKHEMDAEAGIVLASHGGSSFVLTSPRGARGGSYSARELEAMNRLAGLLSMVTSFALRLKLATASTMLDSLGSRGEALALLTQTGRILHMTVGFEALLQGRLMLRAGRIRASDPADDNPLQALIARTGGWLSAPEEPLPPIVLRRHTGPPLVARCLPVAGAARDFLGLARVVLAVDDLTPVAQGVELPLRSSFGLTPAEARLAIRIARGEALREAADAEGITFETARTRLKSVFAKTETNRQAELALMVARLAR